MEGEPTLREGGKQRRLEVGGWRCRDGGLEPKTLPTKTSLRLSVAASPRIYHRCLSGFDLQEISLPSF
jgi:hypothetical protein